jgi:hypothetical protein
MQLYSHIEPFKQDPVSGCMYAGQQQHLWCAGWLARSAEGFDHTHALHKAATIAAAAA